MSAGYLVAHRESFGEYPEKRPFGRVSNRLGEMIIVRRVPDEIHWYGVPHPAPCIVTVVRLGKRMRCSVFRAGGRSPNEMCFTRIA